MILTKSYMAVSIRWVYVGGPLTGLLGLLYGGLTSSLWTPLYTQDLLPSGEGSCFCLGLDLCRFPRGHRPSSRTECRPQVSLFLGFRAPGGPRFACLNSR